MPARPTLAPCIRFLSINKWARRTKSLDALLPVLYLRGVSTGDFQEALAALLGKDAPNLSPAVIARLTAEWQADYDAWRKRDLSARRYVYVWDGVYLQARMEDAAECMLVLIGATPEGKKELVGFQTGVRESAQSWRELLIDIKQRGLEIAPDLAVGDGALGFWKAIEQVFPSTRHQRCWVHKTANVEIREEKLSAFDCSRSYLEHIICYAVRNAGSLPACLCPSCLRVPMSRVRGPRTFYAAPPRLPRTPHLRRNARWGDTARA